MTPDRTTGVAETMRAMVLTGHGGLDKLVLRDVPRPRPGRGEVLVKVGACGVNNTEINTRTAWYDRAVNAGVFSVELGLHGLDGPPLRPALKRSHRGTARLSHSRVYRAPPSPALL
jgi:hypothetical protein